MKKRILSALMCLTLIGTSVIGCSSNKGSEGTKGTENVTLTILQHSPEMTEQMQAMAEQYNKEHPNVKIELTILQNDYPTVLKTKINSGDIPDLFMTGAYNENEVYKDYIYDLTNESFMSNIDDAAKKGVTSDDGKITGFPFVFQAHSFIYNKGLFKKIGITEENLPKTLSQYEEVCKKLQAEGIIPFSNGYKEWWVLEQTTTQCMAAVGGDYQSLFKEINAGSKKFSDVKEGMKIFDLIDLTLKYGNDKPLETDANQQVALFAQGKAAMMHQGTWSEDGIKKIDPSIEIGFLPGPIGEEADKAGVMVDSNIVYRVNKSSKNLKYALDLLNWLTTSDYGKKFVPEKTKQISTVKGAPAADSALAKETLKYLEAGKTYPWVKGYWPDGYEQKIGEILQMYISKDYTKEQAIKAIDETYSKLAKVQNSK